MGAPQVHGAGSHDENLCTTVKPEDFVPAKRPLRPAMLQGWDKVDPLSTLTVAA